jgi:hypothetical protein
MMTCKKNIWKHWTIKKKYVKQFKLTRVSILTSWFKLLNRDNSIKNKKIQYTILTI